MKIIINKSILIFFILLHLSIVAVADTQTHTEEIETLLGAYQKEFVFLDNEIRLLEKRIKEVKQDGEKRITNARSNLYKIEEKLLDLNSRVDRKLEERRIVEEEHYDTEDLAGTVGTIITQATSRLSTHFIPAFEPANPEDPSNLLVEQELEYVFEKSLELLSSFGDIQKENSTFYLQSGQEVEGDIIHIGRIASFGVANEMSGTLGPIGGGKLRIFSDKTKKVARNLAEGGTPETLPIFLYESLDKMAEAYSGNKTIADIIKGGGIIGIVILIIGAIALTLIIVRTIFLWIAGRTDKGVLKKIIENVKTGSLENALKIASSLPGAIGRVLYATIHGINAGSKNVEDIVSESVLNEQPRLNSFKSILTVFAAVAPLLGLLGTVTGMIATFDIITQYGTGDPKLLSGGISEALITTELGLVVAIPVLLIGNLLSSWADRITSGLEVNALRVLNSVTKEPELRKRAHNVI